MPIPSEDTIEFFPSEEDDIETIQVTLDLATVIEFLRSLGIREIVLRDDEGED